MTLASENTQPVDYGQPRNHAFQQHIATSLDFEDALAAVRAVLAEADLWIIHEIDPQMLLKKGGYEIRHTRQILFFHPRYMVRLLGIDPSALLEAPLKIAIMADGTGKVTLRWLELEALFSKYGNDELLELGREFSQTYAAIADRLRQA